jgi:uncharacterized protein with HEPN domain
LKFGTELSICALKAPTSQSPKPIYDFLPDKRDFFAFQKDLKTKKAVERNIKIIGEAFSRILKVNPEIGISNARKIVNTRNRVIHSYDNISDEIIWTIVVRELPILEIEVDELLKATI